MRDRKALFILLAGVALLAGCAPKPPDWVLGRSASYPAEAYLTGIGVDRDRGKAEDRARSEVAKIFAVEIHARDESSELFRMSHMGEAAADREYSQSAQTELVATTDKILQGVRIAEVWQEKRTGPYHVLAVLDRLRAAAALRGELNELDQSVLEQVRRAEAAATPMRRLGAYLQALDALEKRRTAAADLRVVDPSGWVAEPPYPAAAVAARAEEAARGIRLGVELEGDREGIVRGALIRALAGVGMKLAPPWEQDLILRGEVKIEEYQAEEPWHWSIATAQVEFAESGGTPIDALRISVREGSRIAERSRSLALERLGGKLAGALMERIRGLGAEHRQRENR